jgi:hypothetical protein
MQQGSVAGHTVDTGLGHLATLRQISWEELGQRAACCRSWRPQGKCYQGEAGRQPRAPVAGHGGHRGKILPGGS